jgi:hypothetical protein
VLNHSSAVCHFQLRAAFFQVLTCVLCFKSRDYPSWRGQLDCDTVDNQRSHGAKIAGFESADLKPDRCVVLHQNESYPSPDGRSDPPSPYHTL